MISKEVQSPRLKFRSSHQRCYMEKVALKNFTKFTVKHLCQSLFFNKVAGMAADIPNSGRAMNSGQNV